MLNLAGDLIGAGTALAGLLLVFLGNVSTGYDAYAPTERKSVVARFRTRGRIAFASFALALLSAALAMAAKALNCEALATVALVSLVGAFAASVAMAWLEMTEIS